ncbi:MULTISPECIES: hypothetical protein [Burkholderia]|uniref:hypothetical protein n=1 Tax=Burkholderia TaxID=32008 RepID=UPI000F02EBFB|nr:MULTISPECIES: hypothetical protein [Burkholderia]TCW70327.1 hypothetical protein C5O79_11825 [Burkholderia sp. SRS-25]
MNWYCAIECELSHIEASIRRLEKMRTDFHKKTTVSDPAYWRARLHAVRKTAQQNKTLLRRTDEILVLLEKL